MPVALTLILALTLGSLSWATMPGILFSHMSMRGRVLTFSCSSQLSTEQIRPPSGPLGLSMVRETAFGGSSEQTLIPTHTHTHTVTHNIQSHLTSTLTFSHIAHRCTLTHFCSHFHTHAHRLRHLHSLICTHTCSHMCMHSHILLNAHRLNLCLHTHIHT